MQERKQIGILLIATNKYKQFVQPLLDGLSKNFLLNHNITIFLFTDDVSEFEYVKKERLNIVLAKIPSYKFPQATLYRYRIFDEHKVLFDQIDYLFYLDVDMRIENEVGEEILGERLTAVHHPGFYMSNGWGSEGCRADSLAYLPKNQRFNYCAGGFQGGKSDYYLLACNMLNSRIQDDERRGVMAEWHDETHWNWMLNACELGREYLKLSPSYCMVEDMTRRRLWGIDNLEPKIVALNKNHKEIRE